MGEARTPAPGGQVATRPIFGVPELSLGKVSFKGLSLLAAPNMPGAVGELDGVLGNDLLQALSLTLDYGNGLARYGGTVSGGVSVSFDRGIPVLPVEIGAKHFDVHFDSGNTAGALFLDEPVAKALPLGGEPVERGRARTSFGEFPIMEAPLAADVTVGGAKLPVTTVGWPNPRPGANLGSKGMAGMTVAIDAAGKRVLVGPSAAPITCPA